MTKKAQAALDRLLDAYGRVERAHEELLEPMLDERMESASFNDAVYALGDYMVAMSNLQAELGL